MNKGWMWIKRIVITILIVIPILIITPFIAFPIANNIKATVVTNEMKKLPLPERTEFIEITRGCGNTGGTGNHTEILISMLVKSDLSQEKIAEFYKDYSPYIDVIEVDIGRTSTFSMQLLGQEFRKLQNIIDYKGYYIVQKTEDAISSEFDLRGH